MPSPIAHAVSGYVLTKGLTPKKTRYLWPMACYGIFVAIAADFDFIPQIVAGINTHRGGTHSVVFAIAFSLISSQLVSQLVSRSAHDRVTIKYINIKLFTLTLIIYGSHLVLDFFTQGGTGVPLLWPMSHQTFQSAIPLFPAVHHSHGLWDAIHLRFLSFELTYTVMMLWGLSQWNTFKHQRRQKASSFE